MSSEEQPSPKLGIQSPTEAVAMPREFRAHIKNTHFDESTRKVNVFYILPSSLSVCFAENVEMQRTQCALCCLGETGGRHNRFCVVVWVLASFPK